MLEQVGGLLGASATLVRSFHERWDSGAIPTDWSATRHRSWRASSAPADAFSAMTTDRPYRAARSADEALAELELMPTAGPTPRSLAASQGRAIRQLRA